MENKKMFRLCFLFFCVLISLYGVTSSSFLDGKFNPYAYAYFSQLSNLAGLIFFLVELITLLKNKKWHYSFFSGGIATFLTVTLLVFWAAVASTSKSNLFSLNNLTVHLIVPILFLIDSLNNKMVDWKTSYPFKWLVFPLLYFLSTFVMAEAGLRFNGNSSRFPYPFLDIDKQGLGETVLAIFIGLGLFLIVGYILIFVKRILNHFLKAKIR